MIAAGSTLLTTFVVLAAREVTHARDLLHGARIIGILALVFMFALLIYVMKQM